MNGKTLGAFFDLVGAFDPRVVPTSAKKGTFFRYIPAVGSPELLVKTDNGLSINWASAGGGGGAPTGDPNTLAYFDNLGNLVSNLQAQFNELQNSMAIGAPGQTGSTSATGDASEARGEAIGAGSTIVATGDGASAYGQTNSGGDIISSGVGSEAGGLADNGIISATSPAAYARGYADGGATITATGQGASATGFASAGAGGITASGTGASAFGVALIAGTILASGEGAFAFGYANTANSQISSGAQGSMAFGAVDAEGLVVANGNGAEAHGSANGVGSSITSSGQGSKAYGVVTDGGTIISSEAGTEASGSSALGAIIEAQAAGAKAFGQANDSGIIRASDGGTLVHGRANGAGSLIEADTNGGHAFGQSEGSGEITSEAAGASAHGYSDGALSAIRSQSVGSHAHGVATLGGAIIATTQGSHASGVAENQGSIVAQTNSAGFARGYVVGDGGVNVCQIVASGFGSFASGSAVTSGINNARILAQGQGAHALGFTQRGEIVAEANASLACGYVNAGSAEIRVSGVGSVGFGHVNLGGVFNVAGAGSIGGVYKSVIGNYFVSGNGVIAWGDIHSITANYASVFGLGHTVGAYAATVIGRYASAPGTPNAWVATDPVFVVGNGTGVGAEATAFQIDKDGKVTTTAAQRHAACRSVSADTTLSARTDRTLFVDTAAAAGAVTVTFPVGEDGLEFFVKDSGANANVNNVLFAASGGDTIEASADITNARGTRHFQFFGGVWYVMNLP